MLFLGLKYYTSPGLNKLHSENEKLLPNSPNKRVKTENPSLT